MQSQLHRCSPLINRVFFYRNHFRLQRAQHGRQEVEYNRIE